MVKKAKRRPLTAREKELRNRKRAVKAKPAKVKLSRKAIEEQLQAEAKAHALKSGARLGLGVVCPTCDARIGSWCIRRRQSGSAVVAEQLHADRVDLAKAKPKSAPKLWGVSGKLDPIEVKLASPVEIVRPKYHDFRPANTRWPDEIKIGKRHRKDFGDIEGLALSFNERGAIIQPIAITEAGDLVAGERRMRAWVHPKSKFKDLPIPVHVITIDAIVAGEWDENAHRKDFTPEEAVSIKKEIEVLLKKHAKDRQRAHGGTAPGRKAPETKDKPFRASERAAALTGTKRRTLEKAEQVVDAAARDPKRFGKLKDDMNRTGKVNGPFNRMKTMEQIDALKDAPAPLPMRGPYEDIVIDFPWPAEPEMEQAEIDERGRSTRPYPAMSIKAGCKFLSDKIVPILAPDCVVWMLTTNYHMPYAYHLLAAMGFVKVSTIITWKKDKLGKGQVLRDQTEHCLIARRGKPLWNLTNETTFLEADRREHSRKPDELYALIERISPSPRYAEIFSRGGRNEKWDCHGDQVGKFAAPDVTAAEQQLAQAAIEPTPLEEAIARTSSRVRAPADAGDLPVFLARKGKSAEATA